MPTWLIIFHVYKFKKGTKTESTAYQQMGNMELRIDLSKDIPVIVEVWFAEVLNQKGGTSRYIGSFRETNERPTQTGSREQKPRISQNNASSEGSSVAFGRRLGVQGHINALLSNPNYYGGEAQLSIRDLIKEAIAIEDEAERQLNAVSQMFNRHAPSTVYQYRRRTA